LESVPTTYFKVVLFFAGEVVFSPYAKDGSKHLDLELDIELEKFRKRRNLVCSQWEWPGGRVGRDGSHTFDETQTVLHRAWLEIT